MLRVCHETTSVELADSDGELASQRTCRQLLACYGETRSRHCAVGGAWQAVGQPETTVQFKFESRVQVIVHAHVLCEFPPTNSCCSLNPWQGHDSLANVCSHC
jgi:hypothetical protein